MPTVRNFLTTCNLSHEIDVSLIQRFFSEQLHGQLEVTVPTDGKHYRILRMAMEKRPQ
jgi:excinuclease ABC subunit C